MTSPRSPTCDRRHRGGVQHQRRRASRRDFAADGEGSDRRPVVRPRPDPRVRSSAARRTVGGSVRRYVVDEIRFVRPDVALVRKLAWATDADGNDLDVGHAMTALYVMVKSEGRCGSPHARTRSPRRTTDGPRPDEPGRCRRRGLGHVAWRGGAGGAGGGGAGGTGGGVNGGGGGMMSWPLSMKRLTASIRWVALRALRRRALRSTRGALRRPGSRPHR